jgi:hypothetical protein
MASYFDIGGGCHSDSGNKAYPSLDNLSEIIYPSFPPSFFYFPSSFCTRPPPSFLFFSLSLRPAECAANKLYLASC